MCAGVAGIKSHKPGFFTAEEPAPGSAARFPGLAGARELIAELIDSGARHFVLGPVGAPPLRWVADEIIRPVLGTAPR